MNQIYLLVIDDNPAIHADFQKILTPASPEKKQLEEAEASLLGEKAKKEPPTFIIDSAYQGEAALALVRKALMAGKHYALAFVDIRMPPGIDGVKTVKALWAMDPNIQIVLCTAYSDYSWDELNKQLDNTDHFLILKKPFENIEVLQLANALTKKWQLQEKMRPR